MRPYEKTYHGNGASISYVVIPDVPPGDQEDFERFLVGSPKPSIDVEGDNQMRCAYYADYLLFLRHRDKLVGKPAHLHIEAAQAGPLAVLEVYGYTIPHDIDTELKVLAFLEIAQEEGNHPIQGYIDRLTVEHFHPADHQARFKLILERHQCGGCIRTEMEPHQWIAKLTDLKRKRWLVQQCCAALQAAFDNRLSADVLRLRLANQINAKTR